MSTESTPLTESGATATPPKTLIAKIITALAIFGAVVQLGESTLAATHHVQRVQFSRLVADFYAFFGAIGVIGIQLNPSNALKKFLLSNFTFLSTPIGIGLFYAFAGSFELTRDPTAPGGAGANFLGEYMIVLGIVNALTGTA